MKVPGDLQDAHCVLVAQVSRQEVRALLEETQYVEAVSSEHH